MPDLSPPATWQEWRNLTRGDSLMVQTIKEGACALYCENFKPKNN
ncbi:uncharacterized protein G2W53_042629 [Senna tora]|uniref:Uncharacterized protein n=1 Tax=Senna tora TaxID=362788 RepID=A0A834SJE0_9FABA|nr:uncharacterized protein G2W53_042629 [Senna tora]